MLDLVALKLSGFIKQPQEDSFTVRIRVPGGRIEADQMAAVQAVARKYGQGYVHVTSRQGFEVPWIPSASIDAVRAELEAAGLSPARTGPRIRNLMACSGAATCSRGVMDTQELAGVLDKAFVGRDVQIKKLKMSVAGCPNCCVAPQTKDLGFIGTAQAVFDAETCNGCEACVGACREKALRMENGRPVLDADACVHCKDCINACPTGSWTAERTGYNVVLGGKVGRHPELGRKVGTFVPTEEVPQWIDGVLALIEARGGNKTERLGSLIERVGWDVALSYLPKK